MIPSPIYCRRCGGFTGKHKMTQKGNNAIGEHEHLEDCVIKLYERLKELEQKQIQVDYL